jgi:flagellar L-ring protein precursor FlgH
MTTRLQVLRSIAAVATVAVLSGCTAAQRLSEVGDPPKMTAPGNPTQQQGYRPVTLPMPTPQVVQPAANSMWRPGARAFFKDQRAAEVGDIVTVLVQITDKANMSNKTDTSRTASEGAGLPNIFGLETSIAKALGTADTSNLLSANSTTTNSGSGALQRAETVQVQLAAVVTQILPNGLLAIAGRQEVRVNSELREMTVSGIVRPEDISSSNTITSEKIAEARISYGGRGTLTDVQGPRYGQQVLDILMPW